MTLPLPPNAAAPGTRPTARMPPGSPWAEGRRVSRLWGWIGLALILASVGWMYLGRAQRAAATPDDAGLRVAEEIVAAELREGDGMAFLPAWSAAQRWRFSALWKQAGLDFAAVNPLGDPIDPWDLDGLKRLWVLTTHDHDRGPQFGGLGTVLRHEELGAHMALLLFELPPSQTVFDFRLKLGEARLERQDDKGKIEVCKARGDKLVCGGEWWRDVFSRVHEVGDSRRRGIFVQPHPDRGVTRLVWQEVPPALRLEGRFGNRLWAVRHETGTPVQLRVIVGEEVRHQMTIAPGDFAYHTFGFDLVAADRGLPVRFELSAQDVFWRQTCLDARLIGSPPLDER